MRATIILIAMCAILGADAISLPSFEVGTWDLVDSDGDASWTADKFTQLKNGTFTGEGTYGGSPYTYYGEIQAHTCAKDDTEQNIKRTHFLLRFQPAIVIS